MSDQRQWPRERRELPAELTAAAAANPGGAVAEIDATMVSDPNGYVPAEAIVGVFLVGPDGKATGDYERNPDHGPVRDDLRRLEPPDHWLGWLPDEPGPAVRTSIEGILDQQVAGSVVDWLKIIDEPVFLTSARRLPDDPDRVIATRAALAVSFALGARPPGGDSVILTGVFSWVAAGLDGERADQLWFDLGMSREEAETALKERIYAVGRPS
ncbi:hypothetical protein [Fodinicola acaciae]|uniref:hypothetical protein n=1 Tax=Fodinicola acaciae TaxID=2681555 RepID=UPI0013D603C7|nr:hypothetical protein [Fodinicola acaciae]